MSAQRNAVVSTVTILKNFVYRQIKEEKRERWSNQSVGQMHSGKGKGIKKLGR